MCFLRSHNVSKSQGGALHFVSLFGHTRTAGVHIWSEEEVPCLPDAGAVEDDKKKRHATDDGQPNVTNGWQKENDTALIYLPMSPTISVQVAVPPSPRLRGCKQ